MFFKPIKIGERGLQEEFIDAGVGCNNPVGQLIPEAIREFGTEREVGCIINLGTGKPEVIGVGQPGCCGSRLLRLVKVLKDLATDAEKVATDFGEKYRHCPGLFHRLNVDRGLEDVSMAEWQRLGEVKTHTLAYIRDERISRQIDQIVDALIGSPHRRIRLGRLGN